MQAVKEKKIDVNAVRDRFPVLNQEVNGHPLIYFDNAATSQTVDTVIHSLVAFYEKDHANIHRGIHTLAERSTQKFEETRKAVHKFINSREHSEVIFTKGTTESINLVAQAWGASHLQQGDEIILSQMEHHSNIVPWQLIAEQKGAIIKVIPINDKGELIFEEYQKLLSEKTKLVSVNYISNALGTLNPVKEIVAAAKSCGAVTFIDGAQAAPHKKIDVQEIDCDFLAFSSHKIFGPTGVGILYGKREILERMAPYQGGGEMIKNVSFGGTTYNEIPYKFEAGTPNIGEVIAMKAAIDFIDEIGHSFIETYEKDLLTYATQKIEHIEGLKIIGCADKKASVISFVVDQVHPFDLGQFLDVKGIAVRTGHHCTQPLMDYLGIEGTVRASFAPYNTTAEIDFFIDSLEKTIAKLR